MLALGSTEYKSAYPGPSSFVIRLYLLSACWHVDEQPPSLSLGGTPGTLWKEDNSPKTRYIYASRLSLANLL